MKKGVLGGTFDPVHNGHLAIAREVKNRLALDGVIFVPAGQPRFKTDRAISPAHHRLEMLKLALDGRPSFTVSRYTWRI